MTEALAPYSCQSDSQSWWEQVMSITEFKPTTEAKSTAH